MSEPTGAPKWRPKLPGMRLTADDSTDPLVLQGQELIMLQKVKDKFQKQLANAEKDRDRERITAMKEALAKLEEQAKSVSSPRTHATDELDRLNIGEVGEDLERFQQHDIIQEALSHEVDLRLYSQKLESELNVYKNESLPGYFEVAPQVADLDNAISKCSKTLRDMEDVFCSFQGTLSGLSDEIQYLQDCSVSLSIKLQNRRRADTVLERFLSNTIVPVETIETIVEGECGDSAYVECLKSLHKKIQYVQSQDDDLDDTIAIPPVDAVASRDVIACLQKLRVKAVYRIREYINAKIDSMPYTECSNIHVLQRSLLQKVAYFVTFLRHHAPDYAVQTQVRYIEVMGAWFLSFFRDYQHSLMRATAVLPSAHYLLGSDPTGAAIQTHGANNTTPATHRPPDMYGSVSDDGTTTNAQTPREARQHNSTHSGAHSPSMIPSAYNSFELGDRIHFVSPEHILDPPLHESHVTSASKEGRDLPYELVFRSLQRHLLDHATQELNFLSAYFGESAKVQVFKSVFDPVFADRVEQLESVLLNFYDSVGVMLMVRVVHAHREEARANDLGIFMDDFYETQLDLLWSRLGVLNERHYESLTHFELPMGAHGQVVLASTQQHFVARRYGELLASVFKIVESFPRQNGLKDRPTEDDSDRDQIATIDVMEKRVQELVAPLHEAMLGLLTNMAQTFPSNADKHSFLINNYDQIWTILITERGVSYRGMAQYQELAQSHIGLYVEEELLKYFPRLIGFVKACEDRSESGPSSTNASVAVPEGSAAPDAEGAGALLLQFEREWKDVVKKIDSDIIVGFSNFRTGSDILKKTLTQLLLYYTRFVDIVNRRFPLLTCCNALLQNVVQHLSDARTVAFTVP